MGLQRSELYRHTIEQACWSHSHNRSVFHIAPADIELARLFTYAYRSQTIGTFAATRTAIEVQISSSAGARCSEYLDRAAVLLRQLEAWAIAPVPRDFRAVILSLYYYDQWINQVVDLLEAAYVAGSGRPIEHVRDCFFSTLQAITMGNGVYIANTTRVPDQATFVVPNLKISIVPLIYGDHHSWNLALLTSEGPSVPLHRHWKGAEIHLGYSPLKGRAFLDSRSAEVQEGYAMPIPPMTDHGYENLSGHHHIVPFIFGSLVMGGWGVFFDVEPRPNTPSDLKAVSLNAEEMKGTVFLERAIRRAAVQRAAGEHVLIPAWRAGSAEVGGLELSVVGVDSRDFSLTSNTYKIVSVQAGRAKLRLGRSDAELRLHDHVGIPAGIQSCIKQIGEESLVILESVIVPMQESSSQPVGAPG